MVEDDIYRSKETYKLYVQHLEEIVLKPASAKQIYYSKNAANLKYFQRLIPHFEAKDLSYVRRVRYFNMLKFICWATEKDLKDCDRQDIDKVMALAHQRLKSPEKISNLVPMMRCLWMFLFLVRDAHGRIYDL